MAQKEIKIIRASLSFVTDCLDPIIKDEKERGRNTTSYGDATEILRNRIMIAGGLRSKK